MSPLASLTNLTWLQLGDNEIADMRPLASLTNLRWLGVVDNALSVPAVKQQLAALLERNVRIQAQYEEDKPTVVRSADAALEAAVQAALGHSGKPPLPRRIWLP